MKEKCKNPECEIYPYFGCAPHICYWKKGPEYTLGQSDILPSEQFPVNFVPELDEGEDLSKPIPGLCGTYYCPHCLSGKPQSALQESGITK